MIECAKCGRPLVYAQGIHTLHDEKYCFDCYMRLVDIIGQWRLGKFDINHLGNIVLTEGAAK